MLKNNTALIRSVACNNGECIPECRYYPKFGRIEDEVIQMHKKIEAYRKRNTLGKL